ncbi:MAG: phosphodiester glycosidase family protein [Anaerolineae bacterium]|nr:phosphodiester glycosidase family protein [Anaerolineae bacterium]
MAEQQLREPETHHRALLWLVLVVIVLTTLAYSTGRALVLLSLPTSLPFPTLVPSATPVIATVTAPPPTATPAPTHTPAPPYVGWEQVEHGLELRRLRVSTEAGVERLTLVRLDPAVFRFRVVYIPRLPRTVGEWGRSDSLVVNAGFFTPEHRTIGLLIREGRVYGSPFDDPDEKSPGLFAVTTDGRTEIRSLQEQPYQIGEPLWQAVESFPLLVRPGSTFGFAPDVFGDSPGRRTVVAQDRDGRILFVVASQGHFSLYELATFLIESDLDLEVALNLDGGRSTGLWLQMGDTRVEIDSLVPVPSVIVAERSD